MLIRSHATESSHQENLRRLGEYSAMADDARPFDPTRPTAIDLSADLQHRKIGGLGLHFVRRTMDEMTYRRTDRHNHLRMKKRIDHGSAKRG